MTTDRDVEREYPLTEFVAKLRRLANALESGKPFRIQVAGQRFTVPQSAQWSVEHESEHGDVEVEFQLKWKLADAPDKPEHDDEV
jgi:amphi-Trp domain-containing protein